MASRPSFTELVDWIEERLPADRAASVAAAVDAGEEDLRATVAWIRDFHRDRALLPHEAVPAELHDRLTSLFREREHPWDSAGYLAADRVHDSAQFPRAVGFRSGPGTAVAEARRIVAERDDVTLVLEVVEHHTDGLLLQGSVTATAPNHPSVPVPASVAFTHARRLVGRVTCRPDGTFRVEPTPSRVDEVWVHTDDGRKVRAEVALTLG